jgi:hypothetical protein
MALGPRPPKFREPAQNASWGRRLQLTLFNYINHPSLLQAIPTGELWNCQPSSETDPDIGISIEHMSQTILVTDPAYPELFQKTGLDRMPNLHHVTFKIASRITDRQEGRAHEILVTAKAFDPADNVLREPEGNPAGRYSVWMDVGGWAGTPASHLLPILKDIFADWKCVVEYLKYIIKHSQSGDEPVIHPLIHMDILGDGPTFRRSTLRISGTIVFGAGIRNGVPTPILEDDRRWQELRDGRWEDL